jgi:hypothetical protein
LTAGNLQRTLTQTTPLSSAGQVGLKRIASRANVFWEGAQVRNADGDYGTVQAIEFVRRVQPMYDLTVAEAHTFFVGQQQWLVHNCPFTPPDTVRSPKRVEGEFSRKGYSYGIDTEDVVPEEGGFHLHVYQNSREVAKVTGNGGFVKRHGGKLLQKPTQLPKIVRKEIRALVKHVRKNLGELP